MTTDNQTNTAKTRAGCRCGCETATGAGRIRRGCPRVSIIGGGDCGARGVL